VLSLLADVEELWALGSGDGSQRVRPPDGRLGPVESSQGRTIALSCRASIGGCRAPRVSARLELPSLQRIARERTTSSRCMESWMRCWRRRSYPLLAASTSGERSGRRKQQQDDLLDKLHFLPYNKVMGETISPFMC
jgi:hypothetical protein